MEKNKYVVADPLIFGVLSFGYALTCLGVKLCITDYAGPAVLYAILYAALSQIPAGILSLFRKDEIYISTIVIFFGTWLIGLYFLIASGPRMIPPQMFHYSLSTFFFVLLIPIWLLALPAFKGPAPLVIRIAFITLSLLCIFDALGNLEIYPHIMEFIAGIFSFISAVCIYILAWERIRKRIIEQVP